MYVILQSRQEVSDESGSILIHAQFTRHQVSWEALDIGVWPEITHSWQSQAMVVWVLQCEASHCCRTKSLKCQVKWLCCVSFFFMCVQVCTGVWRQEVFLDHSPPYFLIRVSFGILLALPAQRLQKYTWLCLTLYIGFVDLMLFLVLSSKAMSPTPRT